MPSDFVSLPNLSPAPTGGQGAYGSVPGQIGQPASSYAQITQLAPTLPALTRSASSVAGSELAGQLSPETQDFLQQKAAEYGVSMGLPGSPTGPSFTGADYLRSLGLTSENLQQQGVKDYATLLGSTAPTQVSPETQTQIAVQNAINAAAPDPALAAQKMLDTLKSLYSLGRGSTSGGGGGVSGYPLSSPEAAVYAQLHPAPPSWETNQGFRTYY